MHPHLPLLFHVRVPARRRPAVAAGRHAGAGASWLGCTAGRTTLQGEGLQHDDGHSLAAGLGLTQRAPPTTPPSPTRSPSSSRRRSGGSIGPEPEDRFWYLTLYNENYPMPALPRGRCRGGPPRHPPGPLPLRRTGRRRDGDRRVRHGHPAVLRAHVAGGHGGPATAGRRVGRDADAWSVTSYTRCASDALVGRALEPAASRPAPARPFVTEALGRGRGTGGGRHRLPAGRARPGGPMGAPALHVARHRRVRALRHPGGLATVLRGRRRPTWWWPS